MVYRQTVRVALSFVVLLVVAQISPQFLRLWSPWLFALGLIAAVVHAALRPHWTRRAALAEPRGGALPAVGDHENRRAMMVAWYLHDRPLPPTGGNCSRWRL